MNNLIETRRDFLKQATLATVALPLLIGCESRSFAGETQSDILSRIRKNAKPRGTEGMGAIDVPDTVSWKTAFTTTPEDGKPIVISGTVFRPDGKTPAPNTLIYFYHTDKFGIYGREGQPRHGRFRGWMLTDAKGRYELASIRPASYPNSTISQHVHMTVTGTDFREDWIDSILFEGDRFITAREREQTGQRGGFEPIVKLVMGSDGIGRAVRNIQLMKTLFSEV
ncbi:MAG: twin-arginine translocation signal domain-containing protein [Pyrinomonadaceae bacterium]